MCGYGFIFNQITYILDTLKFNWKYEIWYIPLKDFNNPLNDKYPMNEDLIIRSENQIAYYFLGNYDIFFLKPLLINLI